MLKRFFTVSLCLLVITLSAAAQAKKPAAKKAPAAKAKPAAKRTTKKEDEKGDEG